MQTMVIGFILIAAAIGLAIFDVFWPFTVVLALGMALGWWFGRLGALHVLQAWMILPYVAVGFAWTFFKWTRFVEDAYRTDRKAGPPKWSHHSYDFAAYFFYWPIDVVAYVLSDLLEDVWRWVSAMVARTFDRYAQWRFSRAAGDAANARETGFSRFVRESEEEGTRK